MPRFPLSSAVGLLLLLGACATPAARDSGDPEAAAAAHFETISNSPPALRGFLEAMPKGGDIHSHLSGTVYAESYIAWAAEDGLCLIVETATLVVCGEAEGPAVEVSEIAGNDAWRARMIDAWSMRDFVPGAEPGESGHDHFFATFGKFSAAGDGREGDMLAEAAARAARQNIGYLELMNSLQRGPAMRLARSLPWSGDIAAYRQALLEAGLYDLVPAAIAETDGLEARRDALLACGTPAADPGCEVEVRYLQQVIRAISPGEVYAQILLGFLIAETDPPRDRFYIDQVELLGVDADRVRLHIQTTADGVVFSDPFRRDLHGPSHVTTSPVARTAIPPAAQPAG